MCIKIYFEHFAIWLFQNIVHPHENKYDVQPSTDHPC